MPDGVRHIREQSVAVASNLRSGARTDRAADAVAPDVVEFCERPREERQCVDVEDVLGARTRCALGADQPLLGNMQLHERIGLAIGEACAALQLIESSIAITRDSHYQLSNRVAFAWKLASLGIPTVLTHLGCVGDVGIADVGAPFESPEHFDAVFADYARSVVPCSVASMAVSQVRQAGKRATSMAPVARWRLKSVATDAAQRCARPAPSHTTAASPSDG